MNKLIAFLLVLIMWLLAPAAIVLLMLFVAVSIFFAGSQVLYTYFLNELNDRKKRK